MMKKLIDAIIEKGNKEDMKDLGIIFLNLLKDLKDTNKEWYNSIKYKMYKMANGDKLNEELAHKWVECMENKDGTMGEHWSYEETESVRKQYAPELDGCEFYAILNMVYSDYYNQKFSTDDYVKLAIDWLKDKDAPSDKTLKYYMFIIK